MCVHQKTLGDGGCEHTCSLHDATAAATSFRVLRLTFHPRLKLAHKCGGHW